MREWYIRYVKEIYNIIKAVAICCLLWLQIWRRDKQWLTPVGGGEWRDEQICKGRKGGQMKAPRCSDSPLGWRGILRGLTWWKCALVRVKEKKNKREEKDEGEDEESAEKSGRMQKCWKKVGVERVIFQRTRLWYDVLLSLLFLFATSHRGLLLYPLQSCSGTYGGCHSTLQPITLLVLCAQLWIHSLPQVAIHIKTSKDMRGRAHIKAWRCLAHPPARPPTYPSIQPFIHPAVLLSTRE